MDDRRDILSPSYKENTKPMAQMIVWLETMRFIRLKIVQNDKEYKKLPLSEKTFTVNQVRKMNETIILNSS